MKGSPHKYWTHCTPLALISLTPEYPLPGHIQASSIQLLQGGKQHDLTVAGTPTTNQRHPVQDSGAVNDRGGRHPQLHMGGRRIQLHQGV